jgi:hypothetical protein
MTPLFWFAVLFWFGLALILAYEFYAMHLHQGKTISEVFWRVTVAHPILAFALGFVAGHLVWQSASVYAGLCK